MYVILMVPPPPPYTIKDWGPVDIFRLERPLNPPLILSVGYYQLDNIEFFFVLTRPYH